VLVLEFSLKFLLEMTQFYLFEEKIAAYECAHKEFFAIATENSVYVYNKSDGKFFLIFFKS
jgi:hypothetical protein